MIQKKSCARNRRENRPEPQMRFQTGLSRAVVAILRKYEAPNEKVADAKLWDRLLTSIIAGKACIPMHLPPFHLISKNPHRATI